VPPYVVGRGWAGSILPRNPHCGNRMAMGIGRQESCGMFPTILRGSEESGILPGGSVK